ncbi:related to ENP1 - required for pre-rRNA processing and 40S ribosomal subunit synthesis [Melanopsichium pennsylvanicum]|uniref:Related to ENP1 - required for pre-rRNA processing and 40S ribosomal subunit synthesis n=2 Tax=Melanopsichium pennsylvanicum TaxID=63383 RepID=A0AAJ4XLU6_9BASI|nr:related to ENP1-required for pre-rRNA processing and 40S ribosomal subunit synthesis [Melanopsichium pennsylvanicum 4]SNX84950.1 related to ENP1 - required for pre-rRNA processing and 40S ribosomal subunit synthesis [Melanopsichium pennsylvanicum]
MPRIPSTKLASKSGSQRHNPLPQQLAQDQLTSKFGLVSAPGRRSSKKANTKPQSASDHVEDQAQYAAPKGMVVEAKSHGSNSNKDKKYIDPKLSRNILRLARQQQEEIEREELEFQNPSSSSVGVSGTHGPRHGESATMPDDSDDEEQPHLDQLGDLDQDEAEIDADGWASYDANLEIDPSDRALLDKFEAKHADDPSATPADGFQIRGNKTLADLIMQKIEMAEASASGPSAEEIESRRMPPGINPKVIEVYRKVGELLSRYKSGPLPKAFKIVPSLPAWESILYITDPASWTPHATLAAVRIFVSTMKADQMQRFYELILLDKVRDEIQDDGKVSYQTYEAMKKAIYKPAAFFKGFLFPMCESGTLTLKEAAIVSSVLAKVSVPVLHSAAALLRLAEMEYSGPTSLFIRVLLDKKYALPYKVVDSLVFHYLRFAEPNSGVELDKITRERRMPVLWHQSMLVFAQRYKQDLTPDQKSALLDLLRVQKHDGISPEVRRELLTATARGELLDEPVDEDDDMMSV